MESIEYGNGCCWCVELEYGWMIDLSRIIDGIHPVLLCV